MLCEPLTAMWKYHTSSPDRYCLLKDFARQNRRNQTLAEKVLWDQLRGNALNTKVLRQYIVGDYIVDFLIPYYQVVIEVDGAYHAERDQYEDDLVRSEALYRMGFYVLRFTNEQVLFDTEETVNRIREIIESIKQEPKAPSTSQGV